MTALRILLGAAFVTTFCIAAGELFLRALSLTLPRGGRRFAHFVTGAVFVSTFVFTLCAAQQFRTWIVVASGTALIAWWTKTCRPTFRPNFELGLPTLWKALFWIPWAAFGVVYFIVAMSPEMSSDGTGYHLGLVYRYYDHHGFYRISTLMYAGLYGGIEMLFLAAFAIGKHSAAALVHVVFLLLAPFGILAIARRLGDTRIGVVAAMLFYLSPVVGKAAASAYIDTATAVVLIAAFYFLQTWREEPGSRALIPAALLTGFAVACKITAVSFFPYALLAVLTATLAWNVRIRAAAVLTALAALPVLPWVIKNIVQFQNPVFPLMNRLFPSPCMYRTVEEELRQVTAHYGNVAWPDIPWEATVGGKLAGITGPIFLLAPIALLALRRPATRHFVYAFAFVFLTFPANTGGRFLIPSLPFLSLAMAAGILELPVMGTALATLLLIAHAVLSWPTIIPKWSKGYQWRIDTIEWKAALRLTSEREFFAHHWPDYERGLMLDRYVPPGDKVLSPDMGQMAYQRREVLGFSDSAAGRRAFINFITPTTPALGNTATRDIRFPAVTTRAVRIVATTKQDTDIRISEMRFFQGDHEIPRSPKWRVTASTNSWEAPLAFDNISASWWTSGLTIPTDADAPKTWLGVDFGEPATVTRIVIEQNGDQRWMGLQPAFLQAGQWKLRHVNYTPTEVPARTTTRMETRDELLRQGIRWILISESEYGATDLRDHAAEWGVVQAGMVNDFRLWKLMPTVTRR